MPSYHHWSPRGLGELCSSMCLPCIWCFTVPTASTHQMPWKSPSRPLIVTTKNVSVPNIAWGTKSLPLRTVGWRGHSLPSSQAPHRPVPNWNIAKQVSEWEVWQWAASQHWRKSLLPLEAYIFQDAFQVWDGICFPSFIWVLSTCSLLQCLLLQLLSRFRRGVFYPLRTSSLHCCLLPQPQLRVPFAACLTRWC